MAINQIQLLAPRQEQREQQAPKKDIWDKIMQGLEVAGGITGIASNYETIQKARAERAAIEDAKDGILRGKDTVAMAEAGFRPAEQNTPDAQPYKIRRGDQVDTVFMTPPKQETTIRPPDPVAQARLDLDKEKFNYQKEMDKKRPSAAGQVDERGNPISTRKVSSEVGQSIGKYDAAMDHIARLEQDWLDKTSLFSGATQYFPGTDASKYQDAQKLAAQNIGQIIEGGKLTDADFDRYLGMMPTAGDSRERAAEKFEDLKDYIASRKESSISGAAQAGYDTRAFSGVKRPPSLLRPKESNDGVAIASPAPQKGKIENGYEFLGGDPGDPKSWRKVGGK